jgi:hypothetical protein
MIRVGCPERSEAQHVHGSVFTVSHVDEIKLLVVKERSAGTSTVWRVGPRFARADLRCP